MFTRQISARLKTNGISVNGPGTGFTIFRQDQDKGDGGCPVDYLAGALAG